MEYRTFWDSEGRTWQVWLILPTAAERRAAERRKALASSYAGPERRREVRRLRTLVRDTTVPAGYEQGWLCFECESGEKRRLAPVPTDWAEALEIELCKWCELAAAVPRCEPA